MPLKRIFVHTRTAEKVEAFAQEVSLWNPEVRDLQYAPSAKEVTENTDLILTSTNSGPNRFSEAQLLI